ncbi:hypothetical protein BG004_002428 [Podila humilis]|nr:hypothetical protein BG004_002428 [Podila humilis]
MTTSATPLARIAFRQSQRPWLSAVTTHPWRPLHAPIQTSRTAITNSAALHPKRHSIILQQPYSTQTRTQTANNDFILRGRSLRLCTASLAPALRATCLPLIRTAQHRHFHQHQENDDVISFYDDKVTQYANQPLQTVTMKTLLGLGRTDTPGSSEASSSHAHSLESNLQVARYARQELPVRLARLIKATQKLPFIVGTNPYIKSVYKLYYDSFQTITNSMEAQEIRTKEDLDKFAALLQGLVSSHADVVPMLSQGFQECKKYMNRADIKVFLDGMIHARIGIRLIAEQVISLREQRHHQLQDGHHNNNNDSVDVQEQHEQQHMVGVVHTGLKPAELIRTCASFVQELCDVNYGSSPEVVINGQTDAQFTYVPVHLEYILCELLKNAVRATVEQSKKMGRSALNPHGDSAASPTQSSSSSSSTTSSSASGGGKKSMVVVDGEEGGVTDETKRVNEFGHPPVEVTIAHGDHEVTIRIRDQGGGISRENMESIFDYSFTTVKNENESESMDAGDGDSPYGVDSIFKGVSRLAMQAGLGGPIAGLGFGLPLTRIYTQYFGGDIHLISLQGHGCDVFVKLKQIDETLDNLQI